jgi:hypothetical protein
MKPNTGYYRKKVRSRTYLLDIIKGNEAAM